MIEKSKEETKIEVTPIEDVSLKTNIILNRQFKHFSKI